ncbi:hypothetical protein Tco_0035652, partial [Tanacetum coccineum]
LPNREQVVPQALNEINPGDQYISSLKMNGFLPASSKGRKERYKRKSASRIFFILTEGRGSIESGCLLDSCEAFNVDMETLLPVR